MEGRWQVELYLNGETDISEQECFDTQVDALWFAARLMLSYRLKNNIIRIEISDNEHHIATSLIHINCND